MIKKAYDFIIWKINEDIRTLWMAYGIDVIEKDKIHFGFLIPEALCNNVIIQSMTIS